MQLQKLAFIANGWNLAINGEPLISEDAEAWDNGPVYRQLWNHLTKYGSGAVSRPIAPSRFLSRSNDETPYVATLTSDERAVIDHVWRRYGRYGAFKLSDMTHRPGTPWFKAYFGRGKSATIDSDDVLQHYTDLANAARD